jgi:thioredoxin 1
MFGRKKKNKFKAPEATDESFNDLIETDKGILIDFYASWCGPCKILGPIIDELAEEYQDKVEIVKVNTETNPNLSAFFKIKSIPTLAFVKDRRLIEVINGLVPKPNLQEMIEDLIVYKFEKPEEEE